MGLLGRLFGREARLPASGGVCDVCNADFDPAAGYYLGTRTVVLAERYWAQHFSVTKEMAAVLSPGDSAPVWMLDHAIRQMAGQSSAWAVCESCSEYFIFDRDEARAHARAGTRPADGGAVDPSGCVLFAALGWQRTFGDWPANVLPVKIVDTCDMCGKAIHESELSAFATTERMREMRANGLIDADPVRPSRERDGDDGYIQCQPCLARTLARAHRAGAPSRETG